MAEVELHHVGGPQHQEEQEQEEDNKQQRQKTPDTDDEDDVDGQTSSVKTVNKKEFAVRVINTGSLSGLYCMMICSTAFVLTMSLVLGTSTERAPLRGITFLLFYMYVYIAAFLFLNLLEGYIYRFKRQQRRQSLPNGDLQAIEALEDKRFPPTNAIHTNQDADNAMSKPQEAMSGQTEDEVDCGLNEDDSVSRKFPEGFPPFQFTGEGVNLFTRIGLIVFGLGAVLLDVFRLLRLADPSTTSWLHHRATSGIAIIAGLLFNCMQIFSLFKNHKMLINYKPVLMKFGFLHAAAANMCTWILSVVIEANHSIDHPPTIVTNSLTDSNQTNNSTLPAVSVYGSLYDKASPYLYPFVIEFSLLAASLFYKMYTNICMTTVHPPQKEKTSEKETSNECRCRGAEIGLGLGMVMFVGTVVSMCLFLYLTAAKSPNYTTTYIYLVTDIIVNSVSLIATILAFYQFNKLCFTGVLERAMDQNLLLIALSGFYILFGFISFASASQVNGSTTNGPCVKLQLTSSIVTSVQATLQTIFIIDAQYRKASCSKHMKQKPGRSVVTFLLITNLTMWLINTFQLKEMDNSQIFSERFGELSWKIILHIFLPLAAFYRFHASVCLSDVWDKTYSQEHVQTVHILSVINNDDWGEQREPY